uniref:Secreted protein n=1 Tax=Phocoena sinus TaxID=42100 RepID=A0A8C9E7T6_PHOSS
MRRAPPICTVHSTSIAFLFYFFQLFNFVRCKEVGSSLNDCAGRKRTCVLVKEEAGWDDSEI